MTALSPWYKYTLSATVETRIRPVGYGNSATGLIEAALNTPESEPDFYASYHSINRAVRGFQGTSMLASCCRSQRHPVAHGEWRWWAPEHATAAITVTRPASTHCHRIGVVAHKNVGGVQPYLYRPLGLVSVQVVDE